MLPHKWEAVIAALTIKNVAFRETRSSCFVRTPILIPESLFWSTPSPSLSYREMETADERKMVSGLSNLRLSVHLSMPSGLT